MPNMVGCFYSIHPTQIELYALRLLLNHVRGARSYKELRTFMMNGKTITQDSFQAAAVAQDSIYEECKEMLSTDYRYKYKHEFEAHPLLGQTDADASNQDSDNDRWTMGQFAINSALCNMEIMLGETGKSLSDFGLPSPNMDKEQFLQNCLRDQYIADEEDFSPEQARAFYEANHPKLNEGQKYVFDVITGILEALEKPSH